MRKVLSFFILLIVFSLIPVSSVFGISVGVKPKELNLNVPIGRETEAEILVFNAGKEAALYQVVPDNYDNKIFIEPADFRLEPNGNQIVKVIVKAWRPGKFATNLSIIARPIGAGGISVVSGAKIPIVVTVSSTIFLLTLAVIFFLCLLGAYMVVLKKRKLNSANN